MGETVTGVEDVTGNSWLVHNYLYLLVRNGQVYR